MKKTLISILLILSMVLPMFAQRRKRSRMQVKPIVFAVLNDGKSIEPIGAIEKGAMIAVSDGGDERPKIMSFIKNYLQPKTAYQLVFGGVSAGTVTVIKTNPTADCAPNMGEVKVVSSKTKLGGMVMGLATNYPISKTMKGLRRKPTLNERTEVESLIRSEFIKQKVSAANAKTLRSHNLTALDVNSDGKAELVGSYWVETSKTERALLFFIAEKGSNGKYSFGYSDFKNIKQEEVMSKEISAVDEGVYNELLLDALEYNGDRSAEIFTYIQGFEGSSFNTYSKRDGKWTKVFEGSNYHCGY